MGLRGPRSWRIWRGGGDAGGADKGLGAGDELVEGLLGGAMFCRGCGYDLSAFREGVVCPECGLGFDGCDASTFDREPRRRAFRRGVRRWGLLVLLSLLIVSAFLLTALPRPISFDQPRLWVWFGSPIGVQRSPNVGPAGFEVTWWFGEARRVEVLRRFVGAGGAGRVGEVMAVVERGDWDRDEFELEVRVAGVEVNALLRAFNVLRKDDEVFGVEWSRGQPRGVSGGAFSVSGGRVEVMSAIIRHYGVAVRPLDIGRADGRVLVFVPELEEGVLGSGLMGPAGADGVGVGWTAAGKMAWLASWMSAAPALPEGDLVGGSLELVTVEEAEGMGYEVRVPDRAIQLFRIDWRSAGVVW